jgi:ribonucleoside-diphosphate reductase alpha chain
VSNGARSGASAGPSVTSTALPASDELASDVKFCALDNPECEACQ